MGDMKKETSNVDINVNKRLDNYFASTIAAVVFNFIVLAMICYCALETNKNVALQYTKVGASILTTVVASVAMGSLLSLYVDIKEKLDEHHVLTSGLKLNLGWSCILLIAACGLLVFILFSQLSMHSWPKT